MTKRIALIKDGVVENVADVPDDWSREKGDWRVPDGMTAVENNIASPGFLYDGQDFSAPISASRRIITYAEFRRRFTDDEFALVRAAVMLDSTGEAMGWALDAAADNSVNLDSDDTQSFLDKMLAAQIIDAKRKSLILT